MFFCKRARINALISLALSCIPVTTLYAQGLGMDTEAPAARPTFTVSDSDQINRRISEAPPMSFADIRKIYETAGEQRLDCVAQIDPEQASQVSEHVLRPYLVKNPHFLLKFEVKPERLGFNIQVTQNIGESKNMDGQSFDEAHSKTLTDEPGKFSTLGCTKGKDEHAYSCTSLQMNRDRVIPFVEAGEDFAPEIQFEQTTTLHTETNGEILVELMLSYTARKLDWWGRKNGSYSTMQSFLCTMSR